MQVGQSPTPDPGLAVSGERAGNASDSAGAARLRLRRGLLLMGGGVLAVIGSMSIAYSLFWFRLARLKPLEDDNPSRRLN
jgi:hypothetical protein